MDVRRPAKFYFCATNAKNDLRSAGNWEVQLQLFGGLASLRVAFVVSQLMDMSKQQEVNGQDAYTCPYCDRTFTEPGHFRLHMVRTHQQKQNKKVSPESFMDT